MEEFQRAKIVRLRSQHNKFLTAMEDEEGVKQTRHGSSKAARWLVERVDGKPNVIRLKNCETWKYLYASDDPFLLGMTGKKVCQVSPRGRSDPGVEWEPLKEGSWVRLRTRTGNFLRANSGIPPWVNSVTHNVPQRSATQEWVLWMVEILEVDYESESEPAVKQNVGGKNPPLKGKGNQNHPPSSSPPRNQNHQNNSDSSPPYNQTHQNQQPSPPPPYHHPYHRSEPALSRTSSNSSTATSVYSSAIGKTDIRSNYEDYDDGGSPTRSRISTMEVPEPSPIATPKSGRVPSVSQHTHQESQGLEDLDDNKGENRHSDADSDFSVKSNSRPHPLDVTMSKQVLKELKIIEFAELLSSGRDKKLQKALNVLVADAKASNQGQVPGELASLQDWINALRNEHESASQELQDCTQFVTKRLETKTELKKAAAKAHELETMEVGFNNMLTTARAKRDELLRQLEEIENSIKAAERAQADNAKEIEEILNTIGDKSSNLREMEKEDKSWQERKSEAEKKLEKVQEEWVEVWSSFEDL